MIENLISEVHNKFKLNIYETFFENNDEEVNLTTIEAICLEIIKILGKPTISELTEFMKVSQPNMTYRVSSLVDKGYLVKKQSTEDKREYFLELTDKFWEYDRMKQNYIYEVAERMRERFSEEDLQSTINVLEVTSRELMYEIDKYIK